MERHTVSRLIGAPPGYVGYEEGGTSTEAVRRRPYSVILLDEIEKAHRDVFNILLQVLDDGRLTDNQGHTVDFTNTIVVMTSQHRQPDRSRRSTAGGNEAARMREAVMETLGDPFLPEFLNRVDEMMIFHPLGTEADHADRRLSAQAAGAAALRGRAYPQDRRAGEADACRGRVRSDLRGTAAQAGDPAAAGEPAGDRAPRQRIKPGDAVEIGWNGSDFTLRYRDAPDGRGMSATSWAPAGRADHARPGLRLRK